jgi:hypothetical protein
MSELGFYDAYPEHLKFKNNSFFFSNNATVQNATQRNSSEFMTWTKPKDISMIKIIAVGAGGGGGAGLASTTATARGGGGGGGSGALSIALYPYWAIPDVLYITIGVGGTASAVNGTDGGFGGTTFVMSALDSVLATTNPNFFCWAWGGSGGLSTITTTGGTGGAGGPALGQATTQSLSRIAFGFKSYAGNAGGSGGSGTVTAGLTPLPNVLGSNVIGLSGGGGGGGTTTANAGGAGGALTVTNTNYVAAQVAPTTNGSHGYLTRFPILFGLGGTGSGGSNLTAASFYNAGDGGPGCGGGGSGAAQLASGTTGGAAQKSGAGGNGFVIIQCW